MIEQLLQIILEKLLIMQRVKLFQQLNQLHNLRLRNFLTLLKLLDFIQRRFIQLIKIVKPFSVSHFNFIFFLFVLLNYLLIFS